MLINTYLYAIFECLNQDQNFYFLIGLKNSVIYYGSILHSVINFEQMPIKVLGTVTYFEPLLLNYETMVDLI